MSKYKLTFKGLDQQDRMRKYEDKITRIHRFYMDRLHEEPKMQFKETADTFQLLLSYRVGSFTYTVRIVFEPDMTITKLERGDKDPAQIYVSFFRDELKLFDMLGFNLHYIYGIEPRPGEKPKLYQNITDWWTMK